MVLTVLTALTDPTVKPVLVLGRIVAFFGFVLVVGIVMYRVFLKMEEKWHRHRRIAIYAVAFAFLMSYVAERYFGIADITGAYFAGIVMCRLSLRVTMLQASQRARLHAVLSAVLSLPSVLRPTWKV